MEQIGGAPTDAPAPDEPVQTEGTSVSTPVEIGGTPDAPVADSAAVQPPAPAPEVTPAPEPVPEPAPATAVESLFDSRESFHDRVDAILRDPNVPGLVRGFFSGLYDAVRYLESVDFHTDDNGVSHVKPKEQV